MPPKSGRANFLFIDFLYINFKKWLLQKKPCYMPAMIKYTHEQALPALAVKPVGNHLLIDTVYHIHT